MDRPTVSQLRAADAAISEEALAAAVAALIAAWPLPAGACAAGVLALASVMLAPLDPP